MQCARAKSLESHSCAKPPGGGWRFFPVLERASVTKPAIASSSFHFGTGDFGTPQTRARCCCCSFLLLLVLLAILELLELPRHNDSRRLNPLPRLPDKSCESQRQFLDAFRLPSLNRLRRNQLAADADCRSASQNIASRSLLIHATRGNQRNLWQRRFHRADVMISADIGARKYFHEIRARFPSLHNFARSQRAGNRSDIISVRELHNF